MGDKTSSRDWTALLGLLSTFYSLAAGACFRAKGAGTCAALLIAGNIAEGNGRLTKADRRNFFTIARASAQECVPLLEVARRRGFIADAQHADLRGELEVIAKKISGLIAGMGKRGT